MNFRNSDRITVCVDYIKMSTVAGLNSPGMKLSQMAADLPKNANVVKVKMYTTIYVCPCPHTTCMHNSPLPSTSTLYCSMTS